MICAGAVKPTPFSRRATPKFAFGMMVMNPKFHGMKLMANMMFMVKSMMANYGYPAWLDHVIVSNTPILHAIRSGGSTLVGCLPASGLVRNKPMDCVVCFIPFSDEDKNYFKKYSASASNKGKL